MTAAAWPVCTICYEDLRPLSDQHLYCLPSCGHVFHALCVEQWLEYCPGAGGKKKGTCPICKRACGASHPPTRLFFQSTGACPTQASPRSSQGADPEALAAEVARLEQKAASLGRVLDEQRDGIQKLNAEVVRWKEKAAAAETMREAARKEKEYVQLQLNVKTEELSRRTTECGRLQERSLALAKELAALKLSTDMNLQEEEILKLASLGNHGNLENAVDVLKRSLALRNRSYKDLMVQCNHLGRSETRAKQKIEKASELIKKLRARVLDLQKELEEKENNVIRDLRSSKKFKADQNETNPVNPTANNGLSSPSARYGNQIAKRDDLMQDGSNEKAHLNQLTPEAKNDLNLKDNMDTKFTDVIDLDGDDDHLIRCSTKPFGNSDYTLDAQNQSGRFEHDNNEPTTFRCGPSFLKHTEATGKSTFQENIMKTKPQNVQELPISRSMNDTTSWKKQALTIDAISKQATRLASGTGPQQFHNLNSLSDDDFETPRGSTGLEGARRGIGNWSKGMAAPRSLNANANRGNLISVGHDGRGGKVKVLKDHGRFQGSKTPALWPKAQQKAGGKSGQSQIEHFFVKR
ncbi:uncharacterized protein [Lolium perenne]|uniref:uncharacterized protein n=1 Tax=Lolium perenne TaxID=4522 RepID=UPI0021F6095C|nr:uncharacterized protein LOC127314796 [Lolium perenne]